jgi:insertion element IS1 protein InsB
MIGRILEIDYTLAYRWIRSFGESLPEPEAPGDITQMAFDEMWRFIGSKNKLWIIKAIDRRTRRTVAWVLGNRDTATFRRLYEKIRHLKGCAFYADDWDACAKVLPSERHVIGKAHTIDIEHDNSNTRHHLGEDLHDEQKSFRKKNSWLI